MSESKKWTQWLSQLPQKLGKLKYPVLILLLGVLLLLLPEKKTSEPAQVQTDSQSEVQAGLTLQEEKLEDLLSQIQGAGTVKVMLSLKAGEETLYQSDTQLQTDGGDGEGSLRQEDSTVLYAAGSGNQSALVRQVLAPTYQGAIIVCQGADDPVVKLALVQAVASVTGLGTDQITVVKMR